MHLELENKMNQSLMMHSGMDLIWLLMLLIMFMQEDTSMNNAVIMVNHYLKVVHLVLNVILN